MSWADSLFDIDWKGTAKAVLPAAIGTYISGQANQKAAQTLADSSNRASQQIVAGNQAGQARLAEVADRTAPAVQYLRSVMADGANLTPGQNQRVMDTRRQTGEMLSTKVGGRSAAAIASRAALDLENGIYGANRQRADQAAGTLAGQNIAATNAAAGQDINLGSNLARITSGRGRMSPMPDWPRRRRRRKWSARRSVRCRRFARSSPSRTRAGRARMSETPTANYTVADLQVGRNPMDNGIMRRHG